MRNRTNYPSIFLLVLSFLAFLETSAQLKDFFPLTVGTELHYSYFKEDTYFEYPPISKDDLVRNSGTVTYRFLSFSVPNDTTILWLVRETLSIKSMEHHLDSLGLRDTSYYEATQSADLPLYEYTTGFHRLVSSLRTLTLYSNTYRYSDQQSDTMKQVISNDPFFSVSFNAFVNNVGLIQMFVDHRFQGHSTRGRMKKDVNLLRLTSIPISDIPPSNFFLSQNYPNPFNPTTSIEYGLPHTSRVTLEFVSSLGQSVLKVHQGEQAAGHYRFVWNANSLPTGVYYLRFITDNGIQSRKLLLLK